MTSKAQYPRFEIRPHRRGKVLYYELWLRLGLNHERHLDSQRDEAGAMWDLADAIKKAAIVAHTSITKEKIR